MSTYWWDYIAMYPGETAIIIGLIILAYFTYVELSKFWYYPLFITSFGEWRVLRYVGRIKYMENKKLFRKDSTIKQFKIKIRIPGLQTLPMILEREDIQSIKPNKIIMNKKYIHWDIEKSAYILTNDPTWGYKIRLENLQRILLHKIDNIDINSTRAARAAPQTIHSGLMQFSIPLAPGSYRENNPEDRYDVNEKHLFDREAIGSYKPMSDMEDKEE